MSPRRHRRRARRFAAEIGHAWGADSLRRWALALMLERLPQGLLSRAWQAWRLMFGRRRAWDQGTRKRRQQEAEQSARRMRNALGRAA